MLNWPKQDCVYKKSKNYKIIKIIKNNKILIKYAINFELKTHFFANLQLKYFYYILANAEKFLCEINVKVVFYLCYWFTYILFGINHLPEWQNVEWN